MKHLRFRNVLNKKTHDFEHLEGQPVEVNSGPIKANGRPIEPIDWLRSTGWGKTDLPMWHTR